MKRGRRNQSIEPVKPILGYFWFSEGQLRNEKLYRERSDRGYFPNMCRLENGEIKQFTERKDDDSLSGWPDAIFLGYGEFINPNGPYRR